MNVHPPKSSYHTLGGWVIENIMTIPSSGDTFNYENLTISVDEVINRRVTKIKVEIMEKSKK